MRKSSIAKTSLLILYSAFFGCSLYRNAYHPSRDPFFETFFEKARLIMTDPEMEVYKQLDDKESKERFIKDFWAIRDFDPDTEKDAARKEFERRVRFASIRFSWNSPKSRPLTSDLRISDRGWNTDMGRIYIILGLPDWAIFSDGTMLPKDQFEGDFGWRYKHRDGMETWLYEYHRLSVSFIGTSFGLESLARSPKAVDDPVDSAGIPSASSGVSIIAYSSRLTDVLDFVKINYINPKFLDIVQKPLRFQADYENEKIVVRIPVDTAYFKEEDADLHMLYRVKTDVFRNGKKLTMIIEEKSAELIAESAAAKRSFQIGIPFTLPGKGKYEFDIVLEDLTSPILRISKNKTKANR